MTKRTTTLDPREAERFRRFVAYASTSWAESQTELAKIAGISQAMIATIIGGTIPGGGRSLRAISAATGIPVDEILSGAGLERLRAKCEGSGKGDSEERILALEALAMLYRLPFSDVAAVLDEIGVSLPSDVPATTWFDVARAAVERRRQGLPLTKSVTPA